MNPIALVPAALAGVLIGAGARADVLSVSLAYNFNGMPHAGESGVPDDANGFRSISDRGLDLSGGVPPALLSSGASSGLTYVIEAGAGVLDIVHLGDRTVVDGGTWAFDAEADGDEVGVQPSWLTDPDQSSVSVPVVPAIALGPGAEFGLLHQYSNGGGSFDVTLGFADGSSVQFTANAPDWFQAGVPMAPGLGLRYQGTRGTFAGTGAVDQANPAEMLNVVESVADGTTLLNDFGFDVDGRSLNSVTFSGRTNQIGSVAILAFTVQDGQVIPGNTPPDQPAINEPTFAGQIVNPADVHMEAGPFGDPDGDGHFCSDWEIVDTVLGERVWRASCATGLDRVHIHLGDGVFENSQAGSSQLLFSRVYRLRVRFRDDSGDVVTGWSAYAERLFETGPPDQIFPLEADDVLDSPTPAWTLAAVGEPPVVLPDASPTAPSLVMETGAGDLLLEMRGSGVFDNPAPVAAHAAIRVTVRAGSAASLVIGDSNLAYADDDGFDRTIFLPGLSLASGESLVLWVSSSGATYFGMGGQTSPDFSTLARDVEIPWIAEPGFVIEQVAGDFQLPVNIAFLPNPGPNPDDPLFYVSELYGTIKVVERDGTVGVFANNLLNFNPTGAFPGSGEQGLAGIVVDSNGDVFATILADYGGPHYPQVRRFTSADGGRTAASETLVLEMIGEPQGQSHQISSISFGPDDKLYVHMGDGFNAGTAQNLDSFRGKVLRMNRDGSACTDNPFYDLGDGINSRDYVFVSGLRNPFGGAWRAEDGMRYIVENGPSRDRMAQLVAGRNYLWDGSNASMLNFATYNWNPAHAPVNCVFVETGVFGGSGFPSEKIGHLFVAESGPTYATGPQNLGKRITEFVLDGSGDVMSGPTTLVEYVGTGKATVVGLAAGPDGLYFTDLYRDLDASSPIEPGANVWRVRAETPACPADRDGDGDGDIQDLLGFLSSWFEGCPE